MNQQRLRAYECWRVGEYARLDRLWPTMSVRLFNVYFAYNRELALEGNALVPFERFVDLSDGELLRLRNVSWKTLGEARTYASALHPFWDEWASGLADTWTQHRLQAQLSAAEGGRP